VGAGGRGRLAGFEFFARRSHKVSGQWSGVSGQLKSLGFTGHWPLTTDH
jgi:hypothetical protein